MIQRLLLLLATCAYLVGESAVAYTPFPLEIIQPHAGLDTRNRFYRAHPGLEYSVPVSAIGGVFPYRYALITAPGGMTINAATGVIIWPAPIEGKVEVTVEVTDAANAVQQVRWPISVTGESWLFVDAAAPAGGTGTQAAPFRTMLEIYGAKSREGKYSEAHKNRFVYVKNGTYLLDGWTPNGSDVQWTQRQPVVFLAYPGHRPTLDLTGRFLLADTVLDNFYIDGFDVTPMTAKFGFRLTGASSDVTFWRTHFSDFAESTGSDNQSCIMACNGGDGKRWAILDCGFTMATASSATPSRRCWSAVAPSPRWMAPHHCRSVPRSTASAGWCARTTSPATPSRTSGCTTPSTSSRAIPMARWRWPTTSSRLATDRMPSP